MALDTATYVADLTPANPVDSDPITSVDDHIRQIKAALKRSFPKFDNWISGEAADFNLLKGAAAAGMTNLKVTYLRFMGTPKDHNDNDLSDVQAYLTSQVSLNHVHALAVHSLNAAVEHLTFDHRFKTVVFAASLSAQVAMIPSVASVSWGEGDIIEFAQLHTGSFGIATTGTEIIRGPDNKASSSTATPFVMAGPGAWCRLRLMQHNQFPASQGGSVCWVIQGDVS